jgi:ubiquinone/menaquinone biosynthesis C-methylase UbiE
MGRLEIMKLFSMVQMILGALSRGKQRVSILEVPHGSLLDIGGGGEGVIAQAVGAGVVAIDLRLSEIREAQEKTPGTLWAVTDAAALPFRDQCFDHAMAFFSCMYMPSDLLPKVFLEGRRVLKTGGELWIWDAHIVPKGKAFAIRLQVDLPGGRTILTMYGAKAKEQSAAGFASLLQEAGFEPDVTTDREQWFSIRARSR